MVAERINLSELSPARYKTLLAIYDCESEAGELVKHLSAHNFEITDISIVRIALGELPRRSHIATNQFLPSSRYTLVGIILGAIIGLLIGVTLYAFNFLQLTLKEALLIHTVALVVLGVVLGGAIGTILATQNNVVILPPQTTDGFVVVIKMPSYLAGQCEAVAQAMGAKKVIS